MDASTGTIGVRAGSSGSVRWAAAILALLIAIGAGIFLGRALAPSPPQPVRVVTQVVPEGVETLPSDARDLAALKASYGRLLAGQAGGRATTPAAKTTTVIGGTSNIPPAMQYGHKLW